MLCAKQNRVTQGTVKVFQPEFMHAHTACLAPGRTETAGCVHDARDHAHWSSSALVRVISLSALQNLILYCITGAYWHILASIKYFVLLWCTYISCPFILHVTYCQQTVRFSSVTLRTRHPNCAKFWGCLIILWYSRPIRAETLHKHRSLNYIIINL